MNEINHWRRTLLLGSIVICVAGIASPIASAKSQDKTLKIEIIGAGRIGGELGKLWTDAGYKVMLSAVDMGLLQLVAELGANAQARHRPRKQPLMGMLS